MMSLLVPTGLTDQSFGLGRAGLPRHASRFAAWVSRTGLPASVAARLRVGRGPLAVALGCSLGLLGGGLSAQPEPPLAPVVVTATRTAQDLSRVPVTVDVVTADNLHRTPGLTIDEALESSAAFSLFRRTNSLMANPTAQGVSLRNVGPSGAGRTLVLLDGVPLNDPFGGWIAWTKLPRLTLSAAEIVRGGGSSVWGSSALGGTIQLLSAAPAEAGSQARLEIGDASTASGEVAARAGGWLVEARAFTTDGFWRVGRGDRGPIDRRTDSDHQLVHASWDTALSEVASLSVTGRLYREDRGNGTPLQRNETEEAFVSVRAGGRIPGGPEWSAVSYFQTQEFSNLFTSVSDDRSSETPALDQFAVPADAAGAALTAAWAAADATTSVGADARWVRGETREAFFLDGNAFTRRRHAGGEQAFAGVFVHHDRALAPDWRGSFDARVDGWRSSHGHRREWEHASGATLRDQRFADRDGAEFSPTLGLIWQAHDQVRVRTAAYRAFRVPTLNELYRPFRVGNVITEANAQLETESLTGVEASVDLGDSRRSLTVTGFSNELEDAVANVTLGAGPGIVPGVGFVPAGGVGRQRQNLERVRVRGLEVRGRWSPTSGVQLRLDYLLSDARVSRSRPPAADLAGKRLAQVPRHTLVLGAAWQPVRHLRLMTQVRHLSEAFEDDANTLTLAPATVVDLRIAHALGAAADREVFLSVENLFDETVEAGRDADGRVDLGAPRFVHGGLRWTW